MTEKDNIQLAERQIAALNARDLDGYLSRIDENYVGHSEVAPGPIRGRDGARQNMEGIFAGFPDLQIEIEETIASGDMVVVRARAKGTHAGTFAGIPATGKSIVMELCNVLQIRDGKTVQGRVYADTLTMLRQLGVISLPMAAVAGSPGAGR
jgi:steroid delta-isomerase-like uncharacterized protein